MRKRLLLVDGTNFFFKGSWSNNILTWNGMNITCLYSFHLNISKLVRIFEKEDWESDVVICWDGGHYERTRISSAAVEAGIIPKAYKQERREARNANKDDEPRALCDFVKQLNMTEEMLSYTRFQQVRLQGEEADDVVGSLCKANLGKYEDIVLVTTDKDYYQLLWDGVRIYNSTKDEFITKETLKEVYGLENADKWVEVGALAGELGPSSDTIYGVPGIGITFACKLINQYGSIENINKKAGEYFKDYIDKNGFDNFAEGIRTGTYKPPKMLKEAKVLAYQDLLMIALQLKKIRTEIEIELIPPKVDWRKLEDFFLKVEFNYSQKNFQTFIRKVTDGDELPLS